MNILLRSMAANDWPMVSEIYKQGIDTGNATFQQDVPSWDEWDTGHLKGCRFVAEAENELVGWAALSPVSGRCVYAGVAEVSVYVSGTFRGQQIGTKLLQILITESERQNIWTLQAGIFLENKASLKIHQQLDFRIVGYREKIGKMNNVWRNTILLERRSKIAGIH